MRTQQKVIIHYGAMQMNKIMKIQYKFLILMTFIFIYPIASQAHHSALRVCNKTNSTLYVAFVHNTGFARFGNTWTSEGRYIIKAGACTTRTPISEAQSETFIAAWEAGFLWGYNNINASQSNTLANYNFSRNDVRNFCAHMDRQFKIKGTLNQLSRCSGDKAVKFSLYLDLRNNNSPRTITFL